MKKEGVEIDKNYPELDQLIEDMFETMYEASGVGLAAPQINKAIRLFVIDTKQVYDKADEESKEEFNGEEGFKKVFINPEIISYSGLNESFNEGCLSIPDVREDVSRLSTIEIVYYNEKFEKVEEEISGLAARIVQHEFDHIEGVLFTDKLGPLKKKLLKPKLAQIARGNIKPDDLMRFHGKTNSK